MDRQPCSLKPNPCKPELLDRGSRLSCGRSAVAALVGIALLGGCSWLEHSKLKQYQSENERLIGDFRAERKRSSVLGERNEALSDRVAQLENRLAAVSDSLREESVDGSRSANKNPSEGPAAAPAELTEPPSRPEESRSNGLFGPLEAWRGRP